MGEGRPRRGGPIVRGAASGQRKSRPLAGTAFEMCLLQKSGLEHQQQETGSNSRTDNTGYVGAHGVHQQEVGGVVLTALNLGNTGSHRNGGNAGRSDQRIDLAAGI